MLHFNKASIFTSDFNKSFKYKLDESLCDECYIVPYRRTERYNED